MEQIPIVTVHYSRDGKFTACGEWVQYGRSSVVYNSFYARKKPLNSTTDMQQVSCRQCHENLQPVPKAVGSGHNKAAD